LVARTVMGGVAGGIASEIYGGNFWQGFAQGAATAAAAFLFNCAMSRYKMINQSPNQEVWVDTETGKVVPYPGAKPDDTFRQIGIEQKQFEKAANLAVSAADEVNKALPIMPQTRVWHFVVNAAGWIKSTVFDPYIRPLFE